MAESRARHKGPSPLSFVDVDDAMHSCLLRPFTPTSPSHGTEAKERESVQLKPEQAETKRKLEDYLDLVLLSTISAKIGHDWNQNAKKKKIIEKTDPFTEFDWHVHQLEPLNEIWKRDSDTISAGEDMERDFCTPFGRFEQAVLKRFRG